MSESVFGEKVKFGDAILIPKGVPHTVENRGKEEVVFVFSGALKM